MLSTKDEIKSAALRLPVSDREALAEELLLSITSSERETVDAAWLGEVRRRDESFRRGETGASPVEDVIARLQRKAQP